MSAKNLQLITRRTPNPNHHLWNNNGTWWCYVSLKNAEGIKKRHRFSLATNDLEKARRRRDGILADLRAKSGNIAA
jgi:hypothetical protein